MSGLFSILCLKRVTVSCGHDRIMKEFRWGFFSCFFFLHVTEGCCLVQIKSLYKISIEYLPYNVSAFVSSRTLVLLLKLLIDNDAVKQFTLIKICYYCDFFHVFSECSIFLIICLLY